LNNTIVKIVQMGQNQDVETLGLPDVEEIDAIYEKGKAIPNSLEGIEGVYPEGQKHPSGYLVFHPVRAMLSRTE
jgi:hypothetical protein